MRQFPRFQTFEVNWASSVFLSIHHEVNAKNLGLSFSSLKDFISALSSDIGFGPLLCGHRKTPSVDWVQREA